MTSINDIDSARDEISASSAGGAPFLLAFGFTLLVTALVSLSTTARTAALVLLFQGNVALPLAFWLERRMTTGRMSPANPLRALSIQLAMSQIVALPAALLVYMFAPWAVPAAMAAIGGGHFLPYTWLQRSRAYLALGIAVSAGAWALTLAMREAAMPAVLFYIAAWYFATAAVVYRRAQALAGSRPAVPVPSLT
jgi:hypothetical protein